MAKGGRGRKHKLKAMDRFAEYESNWVKTQNHKISKRIIDFAIKNNAGTIKLELLDGFGAEHKDNIVLKNWTYYQLGEMIQYKAKREGITVLHIDPYHTSKTCAECGKVHNIDTKVRKIECECGNSYERDYNAAVNIARSDIIVSKKEECEFYKLKEKKQEKKLKNNTLVNTPLIIVEVE